MEHFVAPSSSGWSLAQYSKLRHCVRHGPCRWVRHKKQSVSTSSSGTLSYMGNCGSLSSSSVVAAAAAGCDACNVLGWLACTVSQSAIDVAVIDESRNSADPAQASSLLLLEAPTVVATVCFRWTRDEYWLLLLLGLTCRRPRRTEHCFMAIVLFRIFHMCLKFKLQRD